MLVRVKADAEALSRVQETFGDVRVVTAADVPAGELAFVTPVMKEGTLSEKLASLSLEVVSRIRIADM